jgi:heat-inducible transcriptional repressor
VRLPDAWLRRIHTVLQAEPAPRDVPEILDRVSTLLAGLSSNVGMGLALQSGPVAHVQRIELVSLETSRMLVVVTLDNGVVRTEVVALDHPVTQATLDIAAEILDDIAADRTPAAARVHLDAALRDRAGAGGELARTVARAKNRVFADAPLQVLHVQGATEIMGQPEFTDPENLRHLVRILDHPEELESVLLEQGRSDTTAIAIGAETQRAELSPFSLVLSPCNVAGVPGFVAILGPMRMRYALALSLVKSVVEAMSYPSSPMVDGNRT